MIENAARMGDYIKAGLEAVRTDAVREVRGRGLMIAVEIDAGRREWRGITWRRCRGTAC